MVDKKEHAEWKNGKSFIRLSAPPLPGRLNSALRLELLASQGTAQDNGCHEDAINCYSLGAPRYDLFVFGSISGREIPAPPISFPNKFAIELASFSGLFPLINLSVNE